MAPVATPAPADDRSLYGNNNSSEALSASKSGFRLDFVVKMKVEYRTLDTRRVRRIQSLQLPPSTGRTVAT